MASDMMNVEEMRTELHQRGITSTGTKPTLVRRLEDAIQKEAQNHSDGDGDGDGGGGGGGGGSDDGDGDGGAALLSGKKRARESENDDAGNIEDDNGTIPSRRQDALSSGNGGGVTNEALLMMAQSMHRLVDHLGSLAPQPQARDIEFARFVDFRSCNPPVFLGQADPMEAYEWIEEMESLFTVFQCTEEQKITYATFMLQQNANFWWTEARRALEAAQTPISWATFKERFYARYFPKSVRETKELEFLSLKQGNMTIEEYTSRFYDLLRFCTIYQGNPMESWKCMMYRKGLKLSIQQKVNIMRISNFTELVETCRIVEETNIKWAEASRRGLV